MGFDPSQLAQPTNENKTIHILSDSMEFKQQQ